MSSLSGRTARSTHGKSMRRTLKLALLLIIAPLRTLACEPGVVSEHLTVDDVADYYLVEVKRAHGDNLIGTINRSFGGVLAPGQTLSIQFVENELADSVCPLEFSVGQTYL